jgi:hypothetical protein
MSRQSKPWVKRERGKCGIRRGHCTRAAEFGKIVFPEQVGVNVEPLSEEPHKCIDLDNVVHGGLPNVVYILIHTILSLHFEKWFQGGVGIEVSGPTKFPEFSMN